MNDEPNEATAPTEEMVERAAQWVTENYDAIAAGMRAAVSDASGTVRTPFVLLLPGGSAEGTRLVTNMPEPHAIGIMQKTISAFVLKHMADAIAQGNVHFVTLTGEDTEDAEDDKPKVH